MTTPKTVKALFVGALLSAFAAASFAQAPTRPAGEQHGARHQMHHKHHGHKHHHHHHHRMHGTR